ncbi:hypothetical protein [Paraburkholderia phenoliruptrix]|uniref:RRXRR domain-containing protein n=1 Tax=Paraburkholderia phenoliruptrix TaxID=252970 RepID=A0ABV3WCW1_9BURK|nr:hypothetical protein [Paraburkholderia phenoliruptrix]MDR6389571.1 hypothetical protein [Paraburkholderia phenoliruptrix]
MEISKMLSVNFKMSVIYIDCICLGVDVGYRRAAFGLRDNRGRLKCAIALEFSAHRMRPFIRWSGYSWMNNKVQNCVKVIFDKNSGARIRGTRLGH